jgi:hypothetical protein
MKKHLISGMYAHFMSVFESGMDASAVAVLDYVTTPPPSSLLVSFAGYLLPPQPDDSHTKYCTVMISPRIALLATALSPLAVSALSFTRPDLVLNGQSPVFTQSRWSWTDCGEFSNTPSFMAVDLRYS